MVLVRAWHSLPVLSLFCRRLLRLPFFEPTSATASWSTSCPSPYTSSPSASAWPDLASVALLPLPLLLNGLRNQLRFMVTGESEQPGSRLKQRLWM